jgi:hypothetical protein
MSSINYFIHYRLLYVLVVATKFSIYGNTLSYKQIPQLPLAEGEFSMLLDLHYQPCLKPYSPEKGTSTYPFTPFAESHDNCCFRMYTICPI